jgi:hypothetical protein
MHLPAPMPDAARLYVCARTLGGCGARLTRAQLLDGPMILYVAGPMTGLPDFNYPAFASAAAELRAAGYEVLSPHEVEGDDGPGTRTWAWYMRTGISKLLRCDGVALLANWHNSRGAMLEKYVADHLEMPVAYKWHWVARTVVVHGRTVTAPVSDVAHLSIPDVR